MERAGHGSRHGRLHLGVAAVCVALALVAGCSGDESSSDGSVAVESTVGDDVDAAPDDVTASGVPVDAVRDVSQPALGRVSDDYVAQLCGLDLLASADTADPYAALLEQVDSVAPSAEEDTAELEAIRSGIVAASEGDREALAEVGATLRARCSVLVVP